MVFPVIVRVARLRSARARRRSSTSRKTFTARHASSNAHLGMEPVARGRRRSDREGTTRTPTCLTSGIGQRLGHLRPGLKIATEPWFGGLREAVLDATVTAAGHAERRTGQTLAYCSSPRTGQVSHVPKNLAVPRLPCQGASNESDPEGVASSAAETVAGAAPGRA
jgi:hypothetical protein